MATRSRSRVGGALRRLLMSGAFVPCSMLLALVLTVGVGVNLLVRAGNWPPAFAQPRTTLLISTPQATAPPTSLHVIVLGAVRTPGLYPLPAGALTKDLIQFAGGAITTADLSRVDLTAPLRDGASVYVPHKGEVIPAERGGKIALNQANATDLHNALGVSTTICKRIIAYRAAHGNFTAVSQLLLVPVTQATFDRIKDLVTV
ncbi:MAG TPA: SLBB domain-containing protein [Ktedonobacterales bacterium]|nr:SLBB domain-containing protein [Ktedonobacterales bacterium]